MPFISTFHSRRGFPCDSECEDLFFLQTIPDMLTAAIARSADPIYMLTARKKLREIHRTMTLSSLSFISTAMPAILKFGHFDTSNFSPYQLKGKFGTKQSDIKLMEVCRPCTDEPRLLSSIASLVQTRTTLRKLLYVNDRDDCLFSEVCY